MTVRPENAVALTISQQTFTVGATITPGCSVTSGAGGVLGSLNFGTHTGAESGRVSTSFVPNAALSLACTPGVALSMTIDNGVNYASVRNLQRAGGTQRVPYRLYTSSSLAANSEITTQPVAISYTDANAIALSIFGAAQLTALTPAGTYTDQLTVTLSW
ncbi:spore coat U domain-containing protein [Yokenella regensburgei]|uniref:Csu type fimbrial protein n=1 Tax=Yokenella regensburgei TaxID=158877 RepID=UPI003F169006